MQFEYKNIIKEDCKKKKETICFQNVLSWNLFQVKGEPHVEICLWFLEEEVCNE